MTVISASKILQVQCPLGKRSVFAHAELRGYEGSRKKAIHRYIPPAYLLRQL